MSVPSFYVHLTLRCECGGETVYTFGMGELPADNDAGSMHPVIHIFGCAQCRPTQALRRTIYGEGHGDTLKLDDLLGRVKWLREHYDLSKRKE